MKDPDVSMPVGFGALLGIGFGAWGFRASQARKPKPKLLKRIGSYAPVGKLESWGPLKGDRISYFTLADFASEPLTPETLNGKPLRVCHTSPARDIEASKKPRVCAARGPKGSRSL